MREYLEKYITIIYYACKTRHHGEFSCTCDLLKKTRIEYWGNSDNRGKCTCLTKNDLNDLIDVLFNGIFKTIDPSKAEEPQKEKEESSTTNSTDDTVLKEKKRECDPVYEYSDIQAAEESFNKLISVLKNMEVQKKVIEYFKSIKFRLDIVCCYMALTHNRSVGNSDLRKVIMLLFGLKDGETKNVEVTELKNAIEVLFGPAKSTVFEKHIELCSKSHKRFSEYEKIFRDIYESYKIVRQLDLQRELEGYFLCFDKMLFTPPQPLENLDKSLPSETDCEKKALDRLSNLKKAKK